LEKEDGMKQTDSLRSAAAGWLAAFILSNVRWPSINVRWLHFRLLLLLF